MIKTIGLCAALLFVLVGGVRSSFAEDYVKGTLIVWYEDKAMARDVNAWKGRFRAFRDELNQKLQKNEGFPDVRVNITGGENLTVDHQIMVSNFGTTDVLKKLKPQLEKLLEKLKSDGCVGSYTDKFAKGQYSFSIVLNEKHALGRKWKKIVASRDSLNERMATLRARFIKAVEEKCKVEFTKRPEEIAPCCLLFSFPENEQERMEKFFASQPIPNITVSYERNGICYPQ